MQDNWTIVIKPKKHWLEINLKELWQYRDLYVMYIKRDFITLYKQTILGPLWFLIQPVLTTLIYMFIFGGLAGISTDGVPQPLFYMSGIILWSYFSASFSSCSNVFVSNAGIFGKVYFPRLIVPLASVTSNLVKTGIQLVMFIAIYIYFYIQGVDLQPNWALCLFPLLILLIAFHALSWGLIISSMTYKYRDLTQLVGFGLQLFMYATPVVYPLSAMPEKYRPLIELNPLTPVFETFKYSCMGCGSLDWDRLFYSFFFMIVTLFVSMLFFNRVERNFMDTV
ncbi:MAG: ABC transporter permease [Coprobacter sp.]|nr:ABC transporter permease [Coprobacter sp.]